MAKSDELVDRVAFLKWVQARECYPLRISDNGEVDVKHNGETLCFKNVHVGLRAKLDKCQRQNPYNDPTKTLCDEPCKELIEPTGFHPHQQVKCYFPKKVRR